MRWFPQWLCELFDLLRAIRNEQTAQRLSLDDILEEQRRTHRAVSTLIAKEAHEAEVLAAIQKALGAVDLPPGKLEAVNTILQANLAKLRGAIASATPAPRP